MKQSKFNFIYKRKAEYVAFNTFSKALLVLSDEEKNMLVDYDSRRSNEIPYEMLNIFTECGFIVDDEDENLFLRYFHYKTKFSCEHLSLTIAPTLDCNFSCPYCYENARKGSMSPSVQKDILSYIKRKLQTGAKEIDIVWYGGEPLLYPDIIDYLASNINALVAEHSATVGMSLVTNGYLLTGEIVDMLVRNDIHNIQITLDGLADNHDQRRHLRDGRGTFDRIIKNLEFFNETPIKVNVRMNVDNRNQADFALLKDTVDAIGNANIGLYPSAVELLNDRDMGRKPYYMSRAEYDSFILTNYANELLCDCGIEIIDNRRFFCSAELENSYVVDELGNFYKCWDEIGQGDSICFNVSQQEDINYLPIIHYVADDPFADPKCRECVFLPLCFGGCRYQKKRYSKLACIFTDETLQAYIESKYFSDQR